MSAMASQITSLTVVHSTIYSRRSSQKNIKARRLWPLWGEFTGDRWIPRTKASNAELFPFPFGEFIMIQKSLVGQNPDFVCIMSRYFLTFSVYNVCIPKLIPPSLPLQKSNNIYCEVSHLILLWDIFCDEWLTQPEMGSLKQSWYLITAAKLITLLYFNA